MIQLFIVIGLFIISGFLVGRRLYRSFIGKEHSGCEKCAANQISKQRL